MNRTLKKLENKLIVSCQAEGDDPFNTPEYVALFAKAAIMGGASAIRSEGVEKTKTIIKNVNVPVIGLIKSYFEDGFVKITGSFKDVESLIKIKCDIIAIDGTFRMREGLTGPEFIKVIKKKYKCVIMADIATLEEGLACAKAGADCVSSTLSGYTPETLKKSKNTPDFKLVKELSSKLNIPVIAEGKVNTPELAAKIIKCGAHSVVVGTAITRPRVVTQWFNEAILKSSN